MSAQRGSKLSRRDLMKLGAAGVLGPSVAGWFKALADQAAKSPERKRSCILLWMSGGPATIDLFDPKPGHANGGPLKAIDTAAAGVKFSELLPRLAKCANDLAVIRSMSTKEGDHGRATYLMRTGNVPQGAIQFPTFGSLCAKELGDPAAALPNFVSISPFRGFNQEAFMPGFLGPKYAPLIVGEQQFGPSMENVDKALRVQSLDRPKGITPEQATGRYELLRGLDYEFSTDRPDQVIEGHGQAYDRAIRLMESTASQAFELGREPDKIREKYGRNLFGQGCLLARRLVERGVPFVEVNLFGWDTHAQNFEQLKTLCGQLDPGWSTLMADLKDRGLLDTTTVLWMGEFGRTPKINQISGRDHFPNAWATVLGGGGIQGGQVYGKTSEDGMTVETAPTSTADLLGTLCKALGIDHMKTNTSNVERPIRIVDKSAKVISSLVRS